MAWRIVQQPNGLFARFSEVVDDITHYAMTMKKALECCVGYGLTPDAAQAKVHRALGSPARYREILHRIRFRYGRRRMLRRRRGMEAIGGRHRPRAAPVPYRRTVPSWAER